MIDNENKSRSAAKAEVIVKFVVIFANDLGGRKRCTLIELKDVR